MSHSGEVNTTSVEIHRLVFEGRQLETKLTKFTSFYKKISSSLNIENIHQLGY